MSDRLPYLTRQVLLVVSAQDVTPSVRHPIAQGARERMSASRSRYGTAIVTRVLFCLPVYGERTHMRVPPAIQGSVSTNA